MNKLIRKAVSITIAVVMMFRVIPIFAASENKKADWAMYVYMCGSDLESEGGSATSDIIEMLDADIPKNVKLIIMTGGASAWDPNKKGAAYNEEVGYDAYITPDAQYNQIYEIDNDKMTLLKTYNKYMDMADPQTAKTFIEYAVKFAPANHIIINFWDHGGALGGAELDEHTGRIMSVRNIANVMDKAKKANGGKKIDIVGFDACAMSTLEVGYVLSPYADYFIASEEVEPDRGWFYGFLSMFSECEDVPSAVDVGKAVIDNYAYSQNKSGDWSKGIAGTLALTDLSVMDKLANAFDALAQDMLKAMDDPKSLVEMLRIAESAQNMYDGTGMIDLYDFVYKLKKIRSLSSSASKVIEVLGTPPGSDNAAYNGHIGSENYVGQVLGNKPAVVYRGVGSKFNNCLGLSVYYPITSSGFKASKASDFIARYNDFNISEEYPLYIMGIAALSDSMSLFSGEIASEYDSNTGTFNMSVYTSDQLDLIKNVNYITTYTTRDENNVLNSYLLGSEMIREGWDNNKFSKVPYETWYSVNGNNITVNMAVDMNSMEVYSNSMGLEGYNTYYYSIPAVMVDESGNEISVELSCVYLDAPDISAVSEDKADLCNKMLIYSIMPVSEDEVAARSIDADNKITIKPALAVYDMESHSVNGYKVYDDAIALEPKGSDVFGNFYELPCEINNLAGNETTWYESYFEAMDIQGNVYLSDPFEYVILNDFSEFKMGAIPPQPYTGEPAEPGVYVFYQGYDMLEEGVDYITSYSNNIEKGTARVTITSLIEDLPGELTAEFIICDPDDVAEECMKLLPEHEIITECTDSSFEYMEHLNILETLKYYYEYGYKLSDESAERINDQYNKMIDYSGLSLKNNGVEILGEFGLFGYEHNRSLIARNAFPISEKAAAALEKAGTAGLIDCYYLGMYLPDEDNSLTKIDMKSDSFAAVKISLPMSVSEDSLEIYRLTDESDEPIPVEYNIFTRNSERYAIFLTDALGYFALFDANAGCADVPSDA